MLSDHSQEIKGCKYLGGGGGTWVNICWACATDLRAPTPFLSILWPIIYPNHR